jgi:hypothetical protein
MPNNPRADEYLSTLFESAFDREVVQEERVFNSLSFFVAAMALTVNVLGYIATKMPAFRLTPYSGAIYTMMFIAALLMVGIIWALFNGVRERVYRLPPLETDTLQWALELRAYYSAAGLRGQDLEDAVVNDVRSEMVSALAQCVVHNRKQNLSRTSARTNGISLMVLQLALAFSIVAVIFVYDRFVASPTPVSPTHGLPADRKSVADLPSPRRGDGPKAATPARAVSGGRLQDPRGQTSRQVR